MELIFNKKCNRQLVDYVTDHFSSSPLFATADNRKNVHVNNISNALCVRLHLNHPQSLKTLDPDRHFEATRLWERLKSKLRTGGLILEMEEVRFFENRNVIAFTVFSDKFPNFITKQKNTV